MKAEQSFKKYSETKIMPVLYSTEVLHMLIFM